MNYSLEDICPVGQWHEIAEHNSYISIDKIGVAVYGIFLYVITMTSFSLYSFYPAV